MKDFSDSNNRFHKENDKYVYRPKTFDLILLLFILAIILCMHIEMILLLFQRREKIESIILVIILNILCDRFLIKLGLFELLSITMDRNGCVLSWLFYKKTVKWDEFKIIKYESYKDYKHRMGPKYTSIFPYKGCVIFSIDDFKKNLHRDPTMYLKKRFSWFYINFYDEKDILKGRSYEPYKFVFDEAEFKKFVNEINLQIENYTD